MNRGYAGRARSSQGIQDRDKLTRPQVYAEEAIALAELPERVSVPLQAMRIGDLGIAAVPCEVFAATGLEIKARSPLKPTFLIELANGYNGYLPTPEQHAWGGYETWPARSSYLEVEAAPKDPRRSARPAGEHCPLTKEVIGSDFPKLRVIFEADN